MKPRAPATPAPRPPLGWLPAPLRAAVATTLLVINTLWWCGLLFVLAIVRLLLPWTAVRRVLDPWLNRVATAWIAGNSGWMRLTQRAAWDVDGIDDLGYRGWYLVVANHQSWVDIFVLQHLLNRRIPMLKFFLKQELIWVPVMGLAWWALDFPFMSRGKGKAALQKDLATARLACEKFRHVPTSVMNFVEGTRATPAKIAADKSPYRHLLRPKVGGLSVALATMGEQFQALLDVTLVYPRGTPSFWDLLCGRLDTVVVRVQAHAIPAELVGLEQATGRAHVVRLGRWTEQLWTAKDQLIDDLLRAG